MPFSILKPSPRAEKGEGEGGSRDRQREGGRGREGVGERKSVRKLSQTAESDIYYTEIRAGLLLPVERSALHLEQRKHSLCQCCPTALIHGYRERGRERERGNMIQCHTMEAIPT